MFVLLYISSQKGVRYLNGARIGGFLVDALHQLMADAALVSVTGCWRRITKIHLEARESRVETEDLIKSKYQGCLVHPEAFGPTLKRLSNYLKALPQLGI